MSVVLLAVRL